MPAFTFWNLAMARTHSTFAPRFSIREGKSPLLLLSHGFELTRVQSTYAFETLGCVRVELKTDALNQQSRAAIARLGAKEEGTLRKHMTTRSGRVRDSVYYSIVDEEWPAVKARLAARLGTAHDHTERGAPETGGSRPA